MKEMRRDQIASYCSAFNHIQYGIVQRMTPVGLYEAEKNFHKKNLP